MKHFLIAVSLSEQAALVEEFKLLTLAGRKEHIVDELDWGYEEGSRRTVRVDIDHTVDEGALGVEVLGDLNGLLQHRALMNDCFHKVWALPILEVESFDVAEGEEVGNAPIIFWPVTHRAHSKLMVGGSGIGLAENMDDSIRLFISHFFLLDKVVFLVSWLGSCVYELDLVGGAA